MNTPFGLRPPDQPPRRVSRAPRDEPMRRMCIPLPLFLLLLLCTSSISCGGLSSSAPAPPPAISVAVAPASVQSFAGIEVQFSAKVQNAAGSSVNWQVNPALGTISASGLYTAPTSVLNTLTVTVTAVLQADSTKTGSSSVTIHPLSAITGPLVLSPALSSLTTSQTLQMHVITDGLSNNLVTWSANGGTITADGLYTPPAIAGAYLITATLPNATGSATVEVTDFAGTLTWRNDNSRSGWNIHERALAPETVTSSTFGKLFLCRLNGYAYAQPLYVPNMTIAGRAHNVVFIATEMDSVYAFDADASTCEQLWQANLIPAGEEAIPAPNSVITSDDIAPFIGITGTPVIDASSSTLYVVAKTRTTGVTRVYNQRLYALDLATGQPKIQPSGVQIATPASVIPAFSPPLENQRAALLLDNNIVYIAFGSHHELGDYHGWLLGYDSATMQQVLVFDVTPNLKYGGIWQSGGGPSADLNHNVYVATGNGPFDADRGGLSYSESFLRLSTAGTIAVADYFSPCDQVTLFQTGQDVGSSAPVLLPDSAGSLSQPRLMMGGAKNGSLYLLDRDNLGGYTSTCPDQLPRAQTVPVGDAAILSTPVFWNNAIYVAAGNGKLKAFLMSGGVLATAASSSQSPETLGPQGATPVVSSNGANNALIWLIDSSGALVAPNMPAILRVFDANNLSNELYNSAMTPSRDAAGPAVKFTVPTVANGKVYVGTQAELDVYGLLPLP